MDASEPGPRSLARRLWHGARATLRLASHLALPPACPLCRLPMAEDGGLCAACWSQIRFIERPYCERLGLPFAEDLGPGVISPAALADPPAFDRARAVAHHDAAAKRLVHGLKYADRLELAATMGRQMARAGAELLAAADGLVPVPLHWTRLWWRRFNQSAALAHAISTLSGVPVRDDLMVRTRATPHQVGLDRSSRAANVQGAFRVPERARPEIRGRRLVLVDDVLTTGATAEACARALSRAGAARIDVLVFSRVVTTP